MKWSKALVAVAGLAMLAGIMPACGGDSDGPKEVDTGLPPEKVLATLSEGEAQQACQRLTAVFSERFSPDTIARGFCTRFGVGLAEDRSQCDELVDSCVDMASEDTEQVMPSDCADATTAELEGCALTVADLETCSKDLAAAFDELLNGVTCADAGQLNEDEVSFDIEQPQSCTRLETECPGATLPVDMMPE